MRKTLAHSSLKSEISVFDNCLVFVFFVFCLLFAVIFANFFPYFKNYIIKMKYVLLELKNTMTHEWGISESYNGGHNILELSDILLSVFLTTSETE